MDPAGLDLNDFEGLGVVAVVDAGGEFGRFDVVGVFLDADGCVGVGLEEVPDGVEGGFVRGVGLVAGLVARVGVVHEEGAFGAVFAGEGDADGGFGGGGGEVLLRECTVEAHDFELLTGALEVAVADLGCGCGEDEGGFHRLDSV